jgi:serine/threonine protein kinase
MGLRIGTRLGPYEILGALGAGGMGEVYRARDTRLDRTVAVKVLPAELAQDNERRARFEREARAISSLNHPHICVLHDFGHQDGTDYIVMELVEGETLADRLKRGRLPLPQALQSATEIARALDAAHRRGVIHRDLKPGNVMLTKTGAKLLDFGLAKPSVLARPHDPLSAVPTREHPLTTAGSLVGTFPYMSPEQLEGKEADVRVDVWALGCIVYEMTTGRRAFEGTSQASLITAIMTEEPASITSLQPLTPPALDRLVRKCLAKDRDGRWDTAHDLASPRGRDRIVWTLAVGLALALVARECRSLAVRRSPRVASSVSTCPLPKQPSFSPMSPCLQTAAGWYSPRKARMASTISTFARWTRPGASRSAAATGPRSRSGRRTDVPSASSPRAASSASRSVGALRRRSAAFRSCGARRGAATV